jgi:hypothetical protein
MENEEKQTTPTEAAGDIVGVGIGMTRSLSGKIIALLLINAGVFFAAAALLPRAGSYGSSGPISEFINSRVHWDIAWVVTLASICITTGAVVLFSRSKRNR